MKVAKNFLKSYVAQMSAAVAVLVPTLDILIGLEPYLGNYGSVAITTLAVVTFALRSIKQAVVSGDD